MAAAIALAVTDNRAAGRIYNVSEPTELSTVDLVKMMGQVVDWQGEIVVVPRSQMPESWMVLFNTDQDWLTNSTRIREELGYAEPVSQNEALKRTVTLERLNPPEAFSATANRLLDYATEDAFLASKRC